MQLLIVDRGRRVSRRRRRSALPHPARAASPHSGERRPLKPQELLRMGYDVDLRGKTAFVAGVADSTGYGWAICKALAEAGATVTASARGRLALGIFQKSPEAGKFDADVLRDGSTMKIAGIYLLDAALDVLEDVPPEVRANKRTPASTASRSPSARRRWAPTTARSTSSSTRSPTAPR